MQADQRLCCSPIPYCWKSHAAAQMLVSRCFSRKVVYTKGGNSSAATFLVLTYTYFYRVVRLHRSTASFGMPLLGNFINKMGLYTRKHVFSRLRTTKPQTSLRLAPLLFVFFESIISRLAFHITCLPIEALAAGQCDNF